MTECGRCGAFGLNLAGHACLEQQGWAKTTMEIDNSTFKVIAPGTQFDIPARSATFRTDLAVWHPMTWTLYGWVRAL